MLQHNIIFTHVINNNYLTQTVIKIVFRLLPMLTLIISQFVVHKIVCFSCLQSIKFNDFFDDAFKSSDFDVEIIGGLLHPDSTMLILI